MKACRRAKPATVRQKGTDEHSARHAGTHASVRSEALRHATVRVWLPPAPHSTEHAPHGDAVHSNAAHGCVLHSWNSSGCRKRTTKQADMVSDQAKEAQKR